MLMLRRGTVTSNHSEMLLPPIDVLPVQQQNPPPNLQNPRFVVIDHQSDSTMRFNYYLINDTYKNKMSLFRLNAAENINLIVDIRKILAHKPLSLEMAQIYYRFARDLSLENYNEKKINLN